MFFTLEHKGCMREGGGVVYYSLHLLLKKHAQPARNGKGGGEGRRIREESINLPSARGIHQWLFYLFITRPKEGSKIPSA